MRSPVGARRLHAEELLVKVYEHVGPDFPGKRRTGQKEVSTQRLSPVPSTQAGPEAAVAPMSALLTRLKCVPCLHRLWTE